MGYVNATKMLRDAYEGKYAVGHLNINNLLWAKTILEVCEEMKSPVMLAASEGAVKFMGGYNVTANLVRNLIHDMKITVPVALHLDHGSSIEACTKAIVAGFSSVMIDRSHAPIETNIADSKVVVDLAKQHSVSVEAEVGTIGGDEDGVVGEAMYAKFEDCEKLVTAVELQCFAPALGSVHGHYKGEPKLGFEQMERIGKAFNVPLVLHGGSGIPEHQVKRAISLGISKINVNTDFQEAYCRGMREYFEKDMDKLPAGYDPRKSITFANNVMKDKIREKIILFGSNNKA